VEAGIKFSVFSFQPLVETTQLKLKTADHIGFCGGLNRCAALPPDVRKAKDFPE
jgi:hypothetical protein